MGVIDGPLAIEASEDLNGVNLSYSSNFQTRRLLRISTAV